MDYQDLVNELTAYDPYRWVERYEGTLCYSTYCDTIHGKKPIILLEIVNVNDYVVTFNFAKGDHPGTICTTNTTFCFTEDTIVQELDEFAAKLSAELVPEINKMLASYYDNIEILKAAGFESNYDSNMDLYQSQYLMSMDSDKIFRIDMESPECLLINEDESIDALEMFDYSYDKDSTDLSSIYATIESGHDGSGRIYWCAETEGSVIDIFEQMDVN